MSKYTVSIHVSGTWTVAIEADNEAAAIGKAQSIWEGSDTSQQVELDPGEFEPGDKWMEADVTEHTPETA
jgi:hypothetical protein